MKLLLGVILLLGALAFLAWPNVAAERRRVRQAQDDVLALQAAEARYFAANQRYLAVASEDDDTALKALGFAPQLPGWAHYEVRVEGDKATVIVEGAFAGDAEMTRFTKELP